MPRKKPNKPYPVSPLLATDSGIPQQTFEEIEKLFIEGSSKARAEALKLLEAVFDSSPLYSILAYLFLNPSFGGELYKKSTHKITEGLQWFADNKTLDDIHLFAYILSAHITLESESEPKGGLLSLLTHFSPHPLTARMQFLLGRINIDLSILARNEFIQTPSAGAFAETKKFLRAAYNVLHSCAYPPSHLAFCQLFQILLHEQAKYHTRKLFKHNYGFLLERMHFNEHLLKSAQKGLIPFQDWHKPIMEDFLEKYSLRDIQSFFDALEGMGDISVLVEASFNFLCDRFKLKPSPSSCISEDTLRVPHLLWLLLLLNKAMAKSSFINYKFGLWLPFNENIKGFESKAYYLQRALDLSQSEEEKLSLSYDIILHLIPLFELSQDYGEHKPLKQCFLFLFKNENMHKTGENRLRLLGIHTILSQRIYKKLKETTYYDQTLASYENGFKGELYYYYKLLLLCEKIGFDKAHEYLFDFFSQCFTKNPYNDDLKSQYISYIEKKSIKRLSTITTEQDVPLLSPNNMNSTVTFFYKPTLYLRELKELQEKLKRVYSVDSHNLYMAFLNQEPQGKHFHYLILLAYLEHYKIWELSNNAKHPFLPYMCLLLSLKGNYYHAFYLLAENLEKIVHLKDEVGLAILKTSFEKSSDNPNILIKYIMRQFYEWVTTAEYATPSENTYKRSKILFLIQALGLEEADIISLFHRAFSNFKYNHYQTYVLNMPSGEMPILKVQREAVEYEEMMTTCKKNENKIIFENRDRIRYLAACLGYATAIEQVSSLMVEGKYIFSSPKTLHLHYVNDFIGLSPQETNTYASFFNETLYEICEVATLSAAVKLVGALSTIECDEISFLLTSLELNWDGQKYVIKIQPVVKRTNSSFLLAQLQHETFRTEDKIKNKLLLAEKEWNCLSSNLEFLQESLNNIFFCRGNIHLAYHEGTFAFSVKIFGSLSNDTIKMLLVGHKDLFQFNIVKEDQFLFVLDQEALKDKQQVDKIVELIWSATVDHLDFTHALSSESVKKDRVQISPLERMRMNLNTAYAVHIGDAGANEKIEWVNSEPNQIVFSFPSGENTKYFNHGKQGITLLEWVAFMQEELRTYSKPVNGIDIHYDEIQGGLILVCRSEALSFNPPDTSTAAILYRWALFLKNKKKQVELTLKTAPKLEEKKLKLEKKEAAVHQDPQPQSLPSNNFRYFNNPINPIRKSPETIAREEDIRRKYYTNALSAYKVARNDLERLQKKYSEQQEKISLDLFELHYLIQKIFIHLAIVRTSLLDYGQQSTAFFNFDSLFKHHSNLIHDLRGQSKSFSPNNLFSLVEKVCQCLSLPDDMLIFSKEKYSPLLNHISHINDLSALALPNNCDTLLACHSMDIILVCIDTDMELLVRIQSAVELPLDKPYGLDENHYLHIQAICHLLHDYHTVLRKNQICHTALCSIQNDFELAYKKIRNIFFHDNLIGDDAASQEKRRILIKNVQEFSANVENYLYIFQRLKEKIQAIRETLPSLRECSATLFVNQNVCLEESPRGMPNQSIPKGANFT